MKRKLFLILLFVFIAALVLFLPGRGRITEESGKNANTRNYDENLIRFDRFGKPEIEGNKAVYRAVLPAEMSGGTVMAFSGRESFVRVRLSGEGEEDAIGSEVYRGPVIRGFGSAGEIPLTMWHFLELNGEDAGKTIELVFESEDPILLRSRPEVLFGTHAEVLMYASSAASTEQQLGIAVIFIGVLVFLFSLVTYNNDRSFRNFILMGIILALIGLYTITQILVPRENLYLYYLPARIGQILYDVIPALYCLYEEGWNEGRVRKKYHLLFEVSLMAGIVLTMLSLLVPVKAGTVVKYLVFTGFNAVFAFCLIWVLRGNAENKTSEAEKGNKRRLAARRSRNDRRNRILIAAGDAALITGNVFGTLRPGPSAGGVPAMACGALVFAMLHAVVGTLTSYSYLEQQLENERELSDGRVKLMISQIRPHFIRNVMTAIRGMIKYDPDEAYDLIYDFNKYLSYNIESLGSSELIPFKMELGHIKTYMKIEKPCLRPQLRVEYDIETEDFEVPPLSIQPFAENAIKHGIEPKPEGGTVRIETRELENAYVIRVTDNGVGYDIHETGQEAASPEEASSGKEARIGHGVGVKNAVSRLALMVDGKVDVESRPGEGTRVTITIPKIDPADWEKE